MFSTFTHVMKSVRDTNSEPGLPVIVPVMVISNLVMTRQIYSEETDGAHAHNRDCTVQEKVSEGRGKGMLVHLRALI